MSRQLRRVSIVVVLMFIALFTSTTIIQAVQSDSLRTDGRNVRTLYASYSAQRGPILVDGQPIAQSVPSDDQYKYVRQYTNPDGMYAPITGYFTLNQGDTGIEEAMNRELTGTADENFLDRVTAIVTGQNPKGDAVELTIDPKIQQAAWDALGGQSGAVVVLDPKTGAVLAMVSKPSYDPNLLASHDTNQVIANYKQLLADPGDPLVNRAIAGDLYNPGSVFKVLMTSALIDSGRFTPDSQEPNPSALVLPGTSTAIHNSEGGDCGGGETVSLADAFRLSCNIPFAQFGRDLGNATIAKYAKAFGFGQKIDIPLPVTPSVYPITSDVDRLMLSSFGQGDDHVTPLQIAMVTAAVANGGKLMKPNLVKSVLTPDLKQRQSFSPEEFSSPISEQTASTVTQLMINNVNNGAASNARIRGVDVAGKTGTAENGEGDPYTLWFTGFAPANDPQAVIAVVVENGGGHGQSAVGNQIAAPIARNVLEAVLSE